MTVKVQQLNKRKRGERSIHFDGQWLRYLAPLVTIAILIGGWQFLFLSGIYPEFIIPGPAQVGEAFWENLTNGVLLRHSSVTLTAMLLGLMYGVSIGALLGYLIAKIKILEDLLSPIIVAFQATPVVAYAPLLI
ncbi:MAG: hypothetical protein AAFV93_10205, partial [Chloroflexota bacterium]